MGKITEIVAIFFAFSSVSLFLSLSAVEGKTSEEDVPVETTTDYGVAAATDERLGNKVASTIIISEKFRDSVEEKIFPEDDEREPAEDEDHSSTVVNFEIPLNKGSSSSANRLQPLLIKSNPIISSLPTQLLNRGSTPGPPSLIIPASDRPTKAGSMPNINNNNNNAAGETKSKSPSSLSSSYNFQYGDFPPGSSTANVKNQLDQLFSKVHSFPQLTFVASPVHNNDGFIQGVQYIKDAYFEVLENLREFRVSVAKRMESIETQMKDLSKKINETTLTLPVTLPETLAAQLDNMIAQSWLLRMRELERIFNMSRMVDHCAHYIVGNHLEEALGLWTSLVDLTKGDSGQAGRNLLDIVKLAYARNSSNSSPVYGFLRRLQGIDKIPVYDLLVGGMKSREDFEGSEIFYIAQYLKERNAVRSSIYSKIPRAIQYAVSGRNVNIVFVGKEHGRNYVHVRDDQSRERSNFYVQASQSYTDTRSAVWNFLFQSSSETFHIHNSLFGDYMFVNAEGFLETLPSNAVLTPGAEFTFQLRNNSVIIHSSNGGQPLVVVRGGGKFPYYFSLQSENPHAPPAQFLVEPDTLL